MSIKYTIITEAWKCPHCQTIVKKRKYSDMILLVYLALLPIVLIVILYKVVYYYFTRNSKPHTKSGGEVVVCKNCGKYLITSADYLSTYTRAVYSKQDMLNIVEPVLKIIREENIIFDIIETEENVVEDIKIKYTNKNNGKSLLTEIYIKDNSIIVLCNEEEFVYTHKEYAYLIINKLKYL